MQVGEENGRCDAWLHCRLDCGSGGMHAQQLLCGVHVILVEQTHMLRAVPAAG
jgi:hypothetical protein